MYCLQHASSPDVMVSLFTAIKLMSKIFYSLNAIDLPEYFEDHMNEWMTMFRKLLIFESNLPQLIGDEDSDTAGLLHKVQALICNNLNLYVGKYEEEFSPYYETFVKDIWTLLVKTPLEAKYDSVMYLLMLCELTFDSWLQLQFKSLAVHALVCIINCLVNLKY
jgi:exportin-2 (importin alpha re-exporter)